jgi:hypothetical protein
MHVAKRVVTYADHFMRFEPHFLERRLEKP